jgi:ligand-binding sensor domain-containing protein
MKLFLSLFLSGIFLSTFAQEYEVFSPSSVELGDIESFDFVQQDELGFIWLADDNTVLRWDGNQTKVYRDSTYLDVVSALCVRERDVFTGTRSGYVLQLIDENWVPLGTDASPFSAAVVSIAVDRDGVVWAATRGEGLYYFDKDLSRWYLLNTEDGLLSNYVNDIQVDAHGYIWIASDLGFQELYFQDKAVKIRNIGLPSEADHYLTAIAYSNSGGVYLSSYLGDVLYYGLGADSATRLFQLPVEAQGISDLEVDRTGRIWIASKNAVWTSFGDSESLYKIRSTGDLPQTISRLLVSYEGLLLIAGKSPGLTYVESRAFVLSSSGENFNGCALINCRSEYMLSTDRKLVSVKPGTDVYESYSLALPTGAVISALFEDSKCRIWLGTFDHGAFVMVGDQLIPIKNSSGYSVFHFSEGENEIWISTLAGVAKVSKSDPDWNCQFASGEIQSNFVYGTLPWDDNQLWVCTDGNGLVLIDSGYNSVDQILSGATIYQAVVDKKDKIWILTRNQGLYTWTRDAGVEIFEPAQESALVGLCQNRNDEMILIHEDAMTWYDMNGLEIQSYLFNQKLINSISSFSSIDVDKNQIIVSSNNRPVVLPAVSPATSEIDSVLIEAIFVDGDQENLDLKTLSRGGNLEVRYTHAQIPGSTRNKYLYRLLPVEQEWNITSDQYLRFIDLKPGKYRLEIDQKGSGLNPTVFPFTVPRPWFMHWLTWLFSLVTLFFVLERYLNMRSKRVKRKQELELLKFKSKYELLQTQVDPHFLFNSLNALGSMIEESNPQSIDFLERMSQFYRKLLEFRNEDLIPLSQEIQVLGDYMILQKLRYEDAIRLDIQLDNCAEIFIPPMSLQILAENAIKHNAIFPDETFIITLSRSQDYIVFSNPIQKKHSTRSSGTGLGLENLNQKYLILTGRGIQISRIAGKFEVSLPCVTKDKA